jgi:uncharacterized protein YecE (DUF72 family)
MDLSVPDKYKDLLTVGTCSWKYDSWKGLVYDPDAHYHAEDYLVDYSRFFKGVEVDQWFWSLFPGEAKMPVEKTVATYAASVPADFRFSVKAPNSITLTHFYGRQTAANKDWANRANERFLDIELVHEFVDSLAPMRSRLGPIMFQFEYLNAKKMPSRAWFFEKLDAFLSELPDEPEFAVEVRNPNLLVPEYFDLLRKHRVGNVLLEGYFMPPVRRVFEQFDTATADFSILRLHGPDRSGIEKRTNKDWSRVVEPKDEGIGAAVDLVNLNVAKNIKTYVNVNNHYEGSAPLSIERFLKVLREQEQ